MGPGPASLLLAVLAFPPRPVLLQEAPAEATATVERRLNAMGTWLEVEVSAAGRAQALAASERAVRALEAAEARLSTWRDDSELAGLNRSPVGVPFALSPALERDLERVVSLWRATGGAFDPGVGALVDAWGLRTGGRQPDPEELEAARASGGLAALGLEDGHAVRRHPGLVLEEGGFGKGIGLDEAADALRAAGARTARLDLGGQLLLLGAGAPVVLADPRDRARGVLELACAPGSVATSGNSEKGIRVDGVARGHLLDPRTGEPAPDFGSLSVWAADATTADCLSTGLYVLGPDEALRWSARHPGVEVVVLEALSGGGLRARLTSGWRDHARALDPALELVFLDPGPGPAEAAGSSPPGSPSKLR